MSSWLLVWLAQVWPKSIFFFLNYPWTWSAADQRPELRLELTPPLFPACCPLPSRRRSWGSWGWQRTHHEPLCHSCWVLSPHTGGFESTPLKKLFFPLVKIDKKQTTVHMHEKSLALMVICIPETDIRALPHLPETKPSTFIQETTGRPEGSLVMTECAFQ